MNDHNEVGNRIPVSSRGQTASLSPEALNDYLSIGEVSLLPHGIRGDHLLRIDPRRREIVLSSPADDTFDVPGGLEYVEVELDESEGRARYVLTVSTADAPDAAYALAYAVVRRTDTGESYAHALRDAVEQFRNLLRPKRRLSPSQETGLLGELTVLLHLYSEIGVEHALQSWLGPEAEQHDFSLENYDLEVKSTLSEDRRHVVHGLDQLDPTLDRELWLLSMQFTSAGRGSGKSLSSLARRAIALAGKRGPSVERALDAVGWREEDAELYTRKYMQRAAPRCYHVDEAFPAITRRRIASVVPGAGLIGQDVTYRIDVDPLGYDAPGPEIAALLQEVHHD
ncbi:PD-(D/E)XK motif protein [Brachybacterium squillarum]|uniref:PD-(D/E)XK motif protein n=1 Tax=Brachybacterium squillarum TaxID=661979 RepID=UPI0022218CC5|nr:PD-(D/E)XK motif protein [Brachybacterium squillarum]MCW1804352.1 PD-(D/E)XK motif protein [Brachybacterium squillarum]